MGQRKHLRRHPVPLVAVLLASVTSLVCFALWLNSAVRFRGDGQILDTGFRSYPRFRIEFPEIPLDKTGEYNFRCSGLPPASFTFLLRVSGDYDVLRTLR